MRKPPRLLDSSLRCRRVPAAGGRREEERYSISRKNTLTFGLDHGGGLRFFLNVSNAAPSSPFRYSLRCYSLIISKLAATRIFLATESIGSSPAYHSPTSLPAPAPPRTQKLLRVSAASSPPTAALASQPRRLLSCLSSSLSGGEGVT